ncbi:hypothetical protein DITRI_Ditri18aG0003100 [Diplodiscus trichospermus]
MAGEGAMFKFLRPRLRPQPVDIQAAGLWGVAATTTALWLIQGVILIVLSIALKHSSVLHSLLPAYGTLFTASLISPKLSSIMHWFQS